MMTAFRPGQLIRVKRDPFRQVHRVLSVTDTGRVHFQPVRYVGFPHTNLLPFEKVELVEDQLDLFSTVADLQHFGDVQC